MKLVFLGPPGAGKGTIASLAKDAWRIPHISTGDIFRANIKNGTQLGLKVKVILDSGGLVSDELTIEIVRDRLAQADCQAGYLLDGFPRTITQAEALAHFSMPDAVVNFVLDDKTIIRRLSGRRICKSCGASFHVLSLPPKIEEVCDACGGELLQRKDDEPSAIQERLRIYQSQTAPLIGYYRRHKILKDIDASASPEVVFKAVQVAIGK